jgi:hypothetical protein
MADQIHARSGTFEASEPIAQHLRVKIASTGKIAVAVAADSDIGTAARSANADGEFIAVNFASKEGTEVFIAGVVVVPGDKLYGAAAGKVNKTNTGAPIGIALSNAAIDGQVSVLRRQI